MRIRFLPIATFLDWWGSQEEGSRGEEGLEEMEGEGASTELKESSPVKL
jgi:hypothetical protein